jgi:hypothetical protein
VCSAVMSVSKAVFAFARITWSHTRAAHMCTDCCRAEAMYIAAARLCINSAKRRSVALLKCRYAAVQRAAHIGSRVSSMQRSVVAHRQHMCTTTLYAATTIYAVCVLGPCMLAVGSCALPDSRHSNRTTAITQQLKVASACLCE